MRVIVFLLTAMTLCFSPAHADLETKFRLVLLRQSRDSYASDWNKIEAKRKQFVQAGNTQMAQIAKEEADSAAQRYQELDKEIKGLELQQAREDLRK